MCPSPLPREALGGCRLKLRVLNTHCFQPEVDVYGKRKITADARSIGEVLRGPVTYSVPANQRDFAWRTQEQIDALWEDLTVALEDGREEYFLGAIVVRPTEGQNGYEIVDGQQRITALSMIFAAIRTKWNGDERASEVSDLYLGTKDRRSRAIIRSE